MRTRLGRDLVHFREETRAVHLRHAHVGDDHRERTLCFDRSSSPAAAPIAVSMSSAIAQLAADAVEHVGLVVDEQHAVAHDGAPLRDRGA